MESFPHKINQEIFLSDHAVFTVIHHVPDHMRHLTELNKGATGDKSVYLVRISTTDSQPDFSLQEMENTFFGAGPNFKTSFEACSFGQLKFYLKGSQDVKLNKSIKQLNRPALLIEAAIEKTRRDYRNGIDYPCWNRRR